MMLLTNCEGKVGMATARETLLQGRSALDAVEQGIRPVEADVTVDSVGRGGAPNLLGEVQCDAAIMDGATLLAGSVGALEGYLHAVSVAREVMNRLPHVMLVGEGAARFAREIGAEAAELLTDGVRERYMKWLIRHLPPEALKKWPDIPLAEYAWVSGKEIASGGTVVFLALDDKGSIAAGTSTSGWALGYPGRLGDSPIIGAGLYADNRYGACACTHIGEMTMRTGTARSVVLYMKKGASVREACQEAMQDLLDLRDGYLGAVVVHAVDPQGNRCVTTTRDLGQKSSYYCWKPEMPEMEHGQAELAKT